MLINIEVQDASNVSIFSFCLLQSSNAVTLSSVSVLNSHFEMKCKTQGIYTVQQELFFTHIYKCRCSVHAFYLTIFIHLSKKITYIRSVIQDQSYIRSVIRSIFMLNNGTNTVVFLHP